MRIIAKHYFLSAFMLCSFIVFSGFDFPKDPVRGDSLVIVRVLTPINSVSIGEPVVFVSKGLNKIEKVELKDQSINTDKTTTNADIAVQSFINTGFNLENATRVVKEGFQLSTFYLKKKAI